MSGFISCTVIDHVCLCYAIIAIACLIVLIVCKFHYSLMKSDLNACTNTLE